MENIIKIEMYLELLFQHENSQKEDITECDEI